MTSGAVARPSSESHGPAATQQLARLSNALADRYSLLELYWATGTVNVYRAWDDRTSRRVNVRIAIDGLQSDHPRMTAHARREIALMAPLFHPNIMPVLDVGFAEEVPYYVTPHVEGRWLSELLDRDYQPRLPAVVHIMTGVARALAHCHAHDVLHCNVKPDNIMLFDNAPILADFFVARRISEGRDPFVDERLAVGTPQYMSPEQWRAEALDARTDLYSLGVVGYQCFTGRLPFDDVDPLSIGFHHISDDVPAPPLAGKGQREVYAVIRKLMAKRPEDRYGSALELIEALGLLGSDEQAAATPLEPYEGEGQYLFVTYVREDSDAIQSVLARISDAGYNLWYDRGIPGGAEWGEVIESRIRNCSGVVLFVSKASVESRMVRREVTFADSLEKRIVALRMDDAPLGHGLQMLLTQYQMLDVRQARADDVARALGFVHAERLRSADVSA